MISASVLPIRSQFKSGHPLGTRESRLPCSTDKGARYAPPIVPGKEPLSRAQQTMCGKIRYRRHKALIDAGQNLPDNGRGGLITFKKIGPPTYKTARFTLPRGLHRPPLWS